MSIVMLPPYAMLAGSMGAAMGAAPDTTAPTLTSPFGLPLGDTSAFQGVTTDEATGTLYFVLTTSATPPSAAQVKLGQDHTGAAAAYAFGQAVSSTGIKSNTATGLTSNTAYYGYLMHEDAAANQSSVAASGILTTLTTGTSDTSFDNLVAAMTTPPTNLRKGYIARMIQALYAGGIWAQTDIMYVLAAHDEQAARLNWITPASYTLSAVNSPTFTADQGFAGNGTTSYLDTTWDAATNASTFTQNDGRIGAYSRNAGGNSAGFGARTSNNISVVARTGANGRGRVNSGSDVASSTGTGATPLMLTIRRSAAAVTDVVRDGASVGSGTNASSAMSNVDLAFGLVGSAYNSQQIAGGVVGGYLDDTEALAEYNAWYAYMVAVSADT